MVVCFVLDRCPGQGWHCTSRVELDWSFGLWCWRRRRRRRIGYYRYYLQCDCHYYLWRGMFIPLCHPLSTKTRADFRVYWVQNIFVAGSIPALGSWNTNNAFALGAGSYTSSNHLWTGVINLPPSTQVQYKVRRSLSLTIRYSLILTGCSIDLVHSQGD